MKILFVEDDPMNRSVVKAMLEVAGATMTGAENAYVGLELIDQESFDLILMDLRMPGMDGLEATRALRARGCRTPILALTADAFEEDRRACLAAGMDDFLTKPLEQSILRGALRRWTRPGWTRPAEQAKFSA